MAIELDGGSLLMESAIVRWTHGRDSTMSWHQILDDAKFVLGQEPSVLLALVPLAFVARRDVFGSRSPQQWTKSRRRFVQVSTAVGLACPIVLLVFSILWLNHTDFNDALKPEFQVVDTFPAVPPETVIPCRLKICTMIAYAGIAALATGAVVGRGRRTLLVGVGIGMMWCYFIAWFTAMCAVGGVWP